MMTLDEQRAIYELRNELMRTIGLYGLLYEGDPAALTPYDRMMIEIDFATKSLVTAQTVLRVLNTMTDRNHKDRPTWKP